MLAPRLEAKGMSLMKRQTDVHPRRAGGDERAQVDGNALVALMFGALMLIDLALCGPGHALNQGAPERLVVAARAIGSGGLAIGAAHGD